MKKGSINLSSANRAGESCCWTYSIDHLGCYHCYLIMKLSSDDHILGRSWKEIVNIKKITMVSVGRILSSNQSPLCHLRERGEILRNVVHHLLLCIQTPSTSNTADQ